VIGRLSRRHRFAGGDRGSGSLEFAVLSLAFLLLVFFMVQAVLYYHARNVVKAEAEGTARYVRAYPTNAGLDAGVPSDQEIQRQAKNAAMDQWQRLDNSGDTTSEPDVRGERVGLNQVRVTVSANPIMIIPGIFGGKNKLTITATAGGPFEVFKRSGED
jgi:Flp pilus assembly protein TadG